MILTPTPSAPVSIFENCHHQFRLSRHRVAPLPGFIEHPLHGFTLAAHESLPVIPLRGSDGVQVGWLLGRAIDRKGRRVVESPVWGIGGTEPRPLVASELAVRAEEWIGELGGRFALILVTPDLARLYLDTIGSLAATYCSTAKVAGSTPTVVLADRPEHPYFRLGIDDYPCGASLQYFPAGLTAADDVRRLLPNHYLDLETWSPVRHWPEGPIPRGLESEIEERVDEIASILCTQIQGAVSGHGPVYMPLTAGRDSRVLAAAAMACDLADRVTFVTFYKHSSKPRYVRDRDVASEIAERFGLRHQHLQLSQPDGSARLEYQLRTGFSGTARKSEDFFSACERELDLDSTWLTGFAGEVGRANFWRKKPLPVPEQSAADILKQTHLPERPGFVSAMASWLEDLPTRDGASQLDLAHWELQVGCWASPHVYGAARFAMSFTPFSHRQIFDRMLQLPAKFRQQRQLPLDLLARLCPEMLDWPFNLPRAKTGQPETGPSPRKPAASFWRRWSRNR